MFSGTIEGSLWPLIFQPGTSWEYGAGIDWAGHLVEVLTKQDLDDYLQDNVWSKLGAKNTTYRPTKYFGGKEKLQESGLRQEDGSLKWAPLPIKNPAKDCIAGAGMYSTMNDYIKLLTALIQGGGPLLKKESVDEMLRPLLNEASRKAMHELGMMPAGMVDICNPPDPKLKEVMVIDHGICGMINCHDVPGRRYRGSVTWGGLPHTAWWIDQEAGVAATFFTQVMPPGDKICEKLVTEVEEALYRIVNQKRN
jgi:CubicO group peptidase (beta-lactamase class C family)